MIALRNLIAWHQDARAGRLRPMAVGGVAIEDFRAGPPTCPDCGFTDPDADTVFVHLMQHAGRDRRRSDRRAAA